MLALLAKLFAGSKITDTIIDVAAGWVENKNTSAQDKKEIIEKLTEYQKATKYQSPTRRFIAVSFTISFIFLILLYVICIFMASVIGLRDFLTIAGQIKLLINDIKDIIMLVLGFYFGIQGINVLRNDKK